MTTRGLTLFSVLTPHAFLISKMHKHIKNCLKITDDIHFVRKEIYIARNAIFINENIT